MEADMSRRGLRLLVSACAAVGLAATVAPTVAAGGGPPAWYTTACTNGAMVVTNTHASESIIIIFPPGSYPSLEIAPGGNQALPDVDGITLTLGATANQATVNPSDCTTPTTAPTTAAPTTAAPTTTAPTTAPPSTDASTTVAPTSEAPPTSEQPGGSDGPLTINRGGPLAVGSGVIVTGGGFEPGTLVVLTIYSTPRQLAAATVPADGNVYMAVPIPAVAAGEHTLVLSGTGTDGAPRILSTTIEVSAAVAPAPAAPPASSGDALPSTGAAIEPFVVAGLLAALSGSALVAVGRPRRLD